MLRSLFFCAAVLVGACGGKVVVDHEDEAAAGSGSGSAASTGGERPEFPCDGPTGPGLATAIVCLEGSLEPNCPPFDDPQAKQLLFSRVIEECSAGFSGCCPQDLQVLCGPAPQGCCYMVLTMTPVDMGCL